ncbi:MAG: hypothetical protein WCX93_13010, partial [Burkholderiaceae bacterium]
KKEGPEPGRLRAGKTAAAVTILLAGRTAALMEGGPCHGSHAGRRRAPAIREFYAGAADESLNKHDARREPLGA